MGRLADDPILTKGENPDGSDNKCWGRLLVNRRYKNKEGKNIVDSIPIRAKGRKADVLATYGRKGKVILVEGQIQTNSKLRPDGSYNNYFEIFVRDIVLGADSKKGLQKLTVEAARKVEPVRQETQKQEEAIPNLSDLYDVIQAQVNEAIKERLQTKPAKETDNPFSS